MTMVQAGCYVESKVTTPGIAAGELADVVTVTEDVLELVTAVDEIHLVLVRGDVRHPADCENHA
jgi:hypothetical protein